MSEPRDTPKEGGETPSALPVPERDHELSQMGGGEGRCDGLAYDVRSGMLGEGESPDHGGMADEG